MKQIITVTSPKGGVGKTTIATNLAQWLQSQGKKVILVDMDRNRTAKAWAIRRQSSNREDIQCYTCEPSALANNQTINYLRHNYDHIIIDTSPEMGPPMAASIIAADLIVLATTPSPVDIAALPQVFTSLDKILSKLPKPVRLLINMTSPNKSKTKEKSIATIRSESPYPVLETMLHRRSAFLTAYDKGEGVLETRSWGKAAAEIRALAEELETTA